MWIIEYGGKFWNGIKFIKDKNSAKEFPSTNAAESYAEKTFSESMYEDCSYWRV